MGTMAKIILDALGSAGLFTFIQFLITRKDNKHKEETMVLIKRFDEKLTEFDEKLTEVEKGSIRTQMLILMNHYPGETSRIMMLARKYFEELKGDWYMTGLFNSWLVSNEIGKPEWFDVKD